MTGRWPFCGEGERRFRWGIAAISATMNAVLDSSHAVMNALVTKMEDRVDSVDAKLDELMADADAKMAENKADADAKMADNKADTDAKMAEIMSALTCVGLSRPKKYASRGPVPEIRRETFRIWAIFGGRTSNAWSSS